MDEDSILATVAITVVFVCGIGSVLFTCFRPVEDDYFPVRDVV